MISGADATELEHKDEYPEKIVEGMKHLGLFGLTIPEEYGGLGESLLTYALREEIARGWMSICGASSTCSPRHRGAAAALPAEDGHRGDPWGLLHVGARLRVGRRSHQDQSDEERRQTLSRSSSRRTLAQSRSTRIWRPSSSRSRSERHARGHGPREDRQDGLQGCRLDRAGLAEPGGWCGSHPRWRARAAVSTR